MRAGRLRHRLYLQQQTETQNAYGEAVITWTTTAEVWGAVEAQYGYESSSTDQQVGNLSVRIIVRYGTAWKAISTTWRVKAVESGRKYDIKAVIQPEQRSRPNTVIELMCMEGLTDDE